MGDNHPVQTLKTTPFPFDVVALTGNDGTSFLEWVWKWEWVVFKAIAIRIMITK